MGVLAEGKIVRLVELYKWRELPLRLDVWPFAILYVAWVTGVATSLDATDAGIVLAALFVLHILTFLFSAWSVNFRCFVQATKVEIAFFSLSYPTSRTSSSLQSCLGERGCEVFEVDLMKLF